MLCVLRSQGILALEIDHGLMQKQFHMVSVLHMHSIHVLQRTDEAFSSLPRQEFGIMLNV